MRYRDTGNLHKDFHLSTDRTIRYVLREYGEDFLRELFYRTAREVYKDIYLHLRKGDWQPLKEHLCYYYDREEGKYRLEEYPEGFTFRVDSCPAAAHLKAKGLPVTPDFYRQITLLNEGWSEGTPVAITTEIEGEGVYTISVRRRENAAQ